jgi:hypothetical protein
VQRYELDAWLGDDTGLTEDQITDLLATAQDIADRYPDPDDADDRETSLLTAYRLLVEDGSAVVQELSAALAVARRAEHKAKVALRQAALIIIEPGGAGQRGIASQRGFATVAGVDRQTVLGWLGK